MSSPASKSKRPEPRPGLAPDPVFAAGLRASLAGEPAVLAAIVGVQGSSPREVGARMLVTERDNVGTIGGGVLEHMAIQRARSLLQNDAARHCLLSFPLGPDSQQCCGGIVTLFLEPLSRTDRTWLERLSVEALHRGVGIATDLREPMQKILVDSAHADESLPREVAAWFDRSPASDARLVKAGGREWLCQYLAEPRFEVALFGAGHVGRALAAALAAHRCRVLWIDPRAEEFPNPLPANASAMVTDEVARAMRRVPPGSMVLVMSHRHPLDYEVCRAVLERGDCAFLGLIGSATKRRRFAKALIGDGLEQQTVTRLCCPIGIAGLKAKEPQVIAASVVAQLLLLLEESRVVERPKSTGISERDAERSAVAASFF